MLYWTLRLIAILVSKVVFRVRIFGKKNIPKKGSFILASNHTSYLDPIVLGAACPRKLNFMAKQELFRNPLFSWLISNVGAFPVERDSADLSALKEAMRRVKQGKPLLLFPEGSRKLDNGFSQPHPGIGFLVAKLGVTVVPAFVKGTESALPKNAKFFRPKKIFVRFGKQISLERGLPYQDIALKIMGNIRQLSDASD